MVKNLDVSEDGIPSTERVSRRINGKVVKGYLINGEFFRNKEEAGLPRKSYPANRKSRSSSDGSNK